MERRAEQAKDQLGMPMGTAANRLRVIIMHDLLKQLDANHCFKCGLVIATPDELSIEHMQPWLHIDPALFWDLKNITFSHRKCNLRDRIGEQQKRHVVNGMLYCNGCRGEVPVEKFSTNSHTSSGFASSCKECKARYERKRRRPQKHSTS